VARYLLHHYQLTRLHLLTPPTIPLPAREIMEHFEAYLEAATAQGANVVPGAVMAVVDTDGRHLRSTCTNYKLIYYRKLHLQERRRLQWRSSGCETPGVD
jgi:hypothetical protein